MSLTRRIPHDLQFIKGRQQLMKAMHFVAHSLPRADGYSIRTQYLAQGQQNLGLEPVVVTRPGFADGCPEALSFRENVDGIPHFHFDSAEYPFFRLARKFSRARAGLERLYANDYYERVVKESAPCDLFHVHMQPGQVRHILPLSRSHNVPLIYEVRGVWEDTQVACGQLDAESAGYLKQQRAATAAADSADRLITISDGLRQDFIKRGIPSDKISVVPNGVDTSRFVPVARDTNLATRLGIKNQTVLGYISSIRQLEGLEYLVRAMPHILKSEDNCICLIVGDGEYSRVLKAVAEKLGLHEKIIFTGRVPHSEILAYYSLIDIFVVPRTKARVNNLVTPLKPLEAMSMAKALLVSGVGGLTELVTDQKTGLVFKPEDAEDLAAQALRLVRNPDLRRKLGDHARSYTVGERDWTRIVAHYQREAMALAIGQN